MSRSLKRQSGFRQPKRTFLVLCEGERTEPDYIAALKLEPAVRGVAAVDIRIHIESAGSAPLTLVREAAELRRNASAHDSEIDEIWCIFDVEWPRPHPNLDEAMALANDSDVKLAISNPCFELWLALHFDDHRSWLDNAAARRLRRSHDGSKGKGLAGSQYMLQRYAAADRARSLDELHAQNDTQFPHNNPSSGMHRFIDAVERPAATTP